MPFVKGQVQWWRKPKEEVKPPEPVEEEIVTDPVPVEVIEDPLFKFQGDNIYLLGRIQLSPETYQYLNQVSEGRQQRIEDVITQAFDYLTENSLL